MNNTNKYVKNLKAIIGLDPTQTSLPAADARQDVGGTRGIGVVDATGTGSSVSGSSGSTLLSDFTDGTTGGLGELGNSTDPGDPTTPTNTGTTSNPAKTGTSIRGGGSGTYDAGNVINGKTNLTLPSNPDPGVGTYVPPEQSPKLIGLTGMTDPSTGNGITLRLNGLPLPPSDWTTIQPPNAYDQWTSGSFWRGYGAPEQYDSIDPIGAAEDARDAAGAGAFTTLISSVYKPFNITVPPTDPAYSPLGDQWTFIWENPVTHVQVSYYSLRMTCPGLSYMNDGVCPINSPVTYPEDGNMQLIKVGAAFIVNPQEAPGDILSQYTDNQHSRLNFKYSSGADNGSILTTSTNGVMIGATSGVNGTFTGNVLVFDSSGQLIAITDQTGSDSYLPTIPTDFGDID